MCGIYFWATKRDVHGLALDLDSLASIFRRGPDATDVLTLQVDDTTRVQFVSSVLHLRGNKTIPQPLSSERFLLQWNGEVYAGLEVGDRSDTLVLFEALHALSGLEAICTLISRIKGEYAFSLYDKTEGALYYGRDYFGRRSLVVSTTLETLQVCSVIPQDRSDFIELSAAGIWRVDLRASTLTPRLIPWTDEGPLFAPVPSISTELPSSPLTMEHYVNISIQAFKASLARRLLCIPFDLHSDPQIAILFSGGIDSVIMAGMANLVLDDETPIDLLNVAFENPRYLVNRDPLGDPFAVPDRLAGLKAWQELSALNPRRTWNFVNVDVTCEEYDKWRPRVMDLMRPSNTVMDLSIAIALWFAARGQGHLAPTQLPYISPAKVLLVGMGADEQLCGYSRHRSAFQNGGREALLREMQMELDRIAHRNLGRDDRCISDHGKEARFPFLDEELVSFLCRLPVEIKADMTRPKGQSEKRLLRLMALRLGFSDAIAYLPKRAIQFGAKTAKMTASRESGADTLE